MVVTFSYVFMREIISYSILVPIVWYYIRNTKQFNEELIQTMKEGFDKLMIALEKHHNSQLEFMTEKLSKTSLTKQQALTMIKEKMWYYSGKKLDFIEQVLEKNNFKGREKYIKTKVKNELLNISSLYEVELNDFMFNCGKLGDIVKRYFEFDEFFNKVMEIIFDDYSKYDKDKQKQIKLKINDIKSLMYSYQHKMLNKIDKEC